MAPRKDDMPEVEKQELEKQAPAQKKPLFELLALVWLVLTAAALGASVYEIAPRGSWFWKPLKEVGSVSLRPILVAALAVGAGVFALSRRLMAGRMGWEKPGQGTWVRSTAYVATLAIGLFAAFSLHGAPGADSMWWFPVGTVKLLGKEFTLRPVFFPSAAVFLTVGVVAHFLYGKPKWTEFLIETEGELKKVSWPPRKEWVGSSLVVILVVATVAMFLYVCDEVLRKVMPLLAGF